MWKWVISEKKGVYPEGSQPVKSRKQPAAHQALSCGASQGASRHAPRRARPLTGGTTKRKQQQRRAALVTALIPHILLFTCLAPAFPQATPAGTVIENEATGTYTDPNTGEIQEVISNKVTVTVAEVAGIAVRADGFRAADGSTSISAGELLYFDCTVTNVGNDPTRFHIPNLATVTGPGSVTGRVQISTNGGATWVDIAATSSLAGFTFTNDYVETASFAPTQSIRVRVPVTVSATATPREEIIVRLGNAPGDGQNQERSPNPDDVYTTDNPDGVAGEAPGVPVNGTREASDSQRATVGAPPLALAALYKTAALPVNAGNPGNPSDDVITYNLTLDIRSGAPPGAGDIAAADLTGTPITLNGNSATRILVSDAVPAGTRLTATPTAPSGWQVIYTKDSPTALTALQSQWYSNPNDPALGNLANVTRVGFVFDGTLPKGTTVTGFSFAAVTSGITGTTSIANIAQVFGSTSGARNAIVYDESGDQNPNNFNDDGTPGEPVISYGIANPATDGTDTSNNSTGTGPGGEDTTVTVTVLTGAVLNGPQGAPAATGPTDNNDDFTNLSAAVPAGTDPSAPVDAAPVTFTNTVQNTGSFTATITLVPTPPANPADLPAGTTVTLSYGNQSATYTYTGSAFITSAAPLSIPNLAPNQTAEYTVRADLPAAAQQAGFPVPVTAFIDTSGNGTPDAGEPANTTIDRVYTGFLRIVKESRLLKGTGPDVPQGSDSFSTASKTGVTGNIIEYRLTYTNISAGSRGPGNRILNASNIVITEDGTTYDPAGNPAGNSWALDLDNADGDSNPTTGIDTSHVPGTAADSAGGTITFFSGRPASAPFADSGGTTAATDVTRYVNTVRGPLGPGQSGTFTFQRRVN